MRDRILGMVFLLSIIFPEPSYSYYSQTSHSLVISAMTAVWCLSEPGYLNLNAWSCEKVRESTVNGKNKKVSFTLSESIGSNSGHAAGNVAIGSSGGGGDDDGNNEDEKRRDDKTELLDFFIADENSELTQFINKVKESVENGYQDDVLVEWIEGHTDFICRFPSPDGLYRIFLDNGYISVPLVLFNLIDRIWKQNKTFTPSALNSEPSVQASNKKKKRRKGRKSDGQSAGVPPVSRSDGTQATKGPTIVSVSSGGSEYKAVGSKNSAKAPQKPLPVKEDSNPFSLLKVDDDSETETVEPDSVQIKEEKPAIASKKKKKKANRMGQRQEGNDDKSGKVSVDTPTLSTTEVIEQAPAAFESLVSTDAKSQTFEPVKKGVKPRAPRKPIKTGANSFAALMNEEESEPETAEPEAEVEEVLENDLPSIKKKKKPFVTIQHPAKDGRSNSSWL